jgi:hypothetical protein
MKKLVPERKPFPTLLAEEIWAGIQEPHQLAYNIMNNKKIIHNNNNKLVTVILTYLHIKICEANQE